MAIKRGIMPKLAEVGKIKTGYLGEPTKSKNGKEFRQPKKVNFFFITTTERDGNGNLILDEQIMDILGKTASRVKKDNDKKKVVGVYELKIRLPFDSVDKNFFTQYMAYAGKKKVCSGDGEKAQRRGDLSISQRGYVEVKGDLSEETEINCDPDTCPIYRGGQCKVSGILSVFLTASTHIGGVHKYRTHSFNAVSSILGALEYFYENTGGILQGLPLKLVMLTKTSAEHGKVAYPTIVIDAEEVMKMKSPQLTGGSEIKGLRLLSVDEKHSRQELNVNMAEIEAKAEQSGFFIDRDPEDIVQEEYFGEGDEPINVTPEEDHKDAAVPKEKGTSPEQLEKKLEKKQGEKKEEPKKPAGNQPEIF